MVYTDRIAELGAVPSTATGGDSHDNAMAEGFNALYKTELIGAGGPGASLSKSNSQPSNWCGGGTTNGFAPSLTTAPPIEAE
jgi:putative transposase